MDQEEKAVPFEIEGGGCTWFFVCGECHGAIDPKVEKCPHCKKRINWEEMKE